MQKLRLTKHQREARYKFRSYEGRRDKERHLRITESMMSSEAWSNLTSSAIELYLHIKIKVTPTNHDDISFTYKEARNFMNGNTFKKSMELLLENGFLRYVRHSPNTRECNIYAMSDKWQTVKKKPKRIVGKNAKEAPD